LIGRNTLVEETQQRVGLELAKERTIFVVNRAHERYYSNILCPSLSNLIEQPCNAGTAPAILYSVLKIASVDPQAVVAVFPSDHYVSDNAAFMAHVRHAFEAAHRRRDLVILLGIEPENPEIAYGWIEPAQTIEGHEQLRRVRRFWEKPSYELAAALQRRGCLWNSFVMIASARALLEMIATATPALYEAFAWAMPLLGTDDEFAMMQQVYALLEEINFSDRVLAVSPERLAVLKVSGLQWNDLGEPGRVRASAQTAGVRPGWLEKMATLPIQRSFGIRRSSEVPSAMPAEPNHCRRDSFGPRLTRAALVGEKKNCPRCREDRQVRYRVYTDLLDMTVCAPCAEQARSLGISVEQLDRV
jgi:mannose-1-phosphate guanylyltransferase